VRFTDIYFGTLAFLVASACMYTAYELHCIRRNIPVKKTQDDKGWYI
jgi:hypothetical protein